MVAKMPVLMEPLIGSDTFLQNTPNKSGTPATVLHNLVSVVHYMPNVTTKKVTLW